MPNLDEIADSVCRDAGGDFAFVLSRRGRLVTQHAPKDMPEVGRGEIARTAEQLLAARRGFGHVEMPRQALVPYGGAAPVDVYLAARPEAVLCLVMATYVPHDKVSGAMSRAVVALDALLEDAHSKRDRRRARKSRPPSSKGSIAPPAGKRATVAPPAGRRTSIPPSSKGSRPPARASSRTGRRTEAPPALDFDDVVTVRGSGALPSPMMDLRRPTPPPLPPEITLGGEAKIGRATLAAIEVDREGPDITYGLAALGRRTIAEIEMSMVPQGDPRSSAPVVRVELASMPSLEGTESEPLNRQTLPFTQTAEELKRAFDAAQIARGSSATIEVSAKRTVIVGASSARRDASAPELSVDIDGDAEPDSDRSPTLEVERPGRQVLDAPDVDITEEMAAPVSEPPGAPDADTIVESGERTKPDPRDSGIDVWHRALSEIVAPPRPKVGRGATGFSAAQKKRPGKK